VSFRPIGYLQIESRVSGQVQKQKNLLHLLNQLILSQRMIGKIRPSNLSNHMVSNTFYIIFLLLWKSLKLSMKCKDSYFKADKKSSSLKQSICLELVDSSENEIRDKRQHEKEILLRPAVPPGFTSGCKHHFDCL